MAILFFGDSLTLGTGDPIQSGWPGRLMPRLAKLGHTHDWYNLGIRGNTSPQILERLTPEASPRLNGDTDRLVLCFGTADCSRQVPADESMQAATEIFAQATAMAPTLFIAPPPVATDWNDALAERVEALLERARHAEVTAIDLFSALEKSATYPQTLKNGDGIHPGAAGYDEISETLLNSVDLPGLLGLTHPD